ncbi:Phosphoribosyltransferase [Niveomyces insectorum RCEF 264]|uniref:adenine phosphoribosyltransferase n=1 Tax=Niveomyces insectorum RCEF 264 TaxID=1081102 RepID=A0A167N7K5_9HYPO|nr:Phosphoribosyltransferase [Niveomyces insectorum RCEF 264]
MTSPVPRSTQSQDTGPGQASSTAPASAAPHSAIPTSAAATTAAAADNLTVAQHASGRQPTTASAAASELASAKIGLYNALRHFPDFPIKGISFIDIMPLFHDPVIHATLLRALELQALHFTTPSATATAFAAAPRVDVVVGLDARGFLFGPGLALGLGAAFAPVRKQGKLPGPCVTVSYEKEYGADHFQMQADAIKPGQTVLVVDDIIATGGSAAAAGELVRKLGGQLIGYLFILEISFLKGREKLGDAPVVTLLEEAE